MSGFVFGLYRLRRNELMVLSKDKRKELSKIHLFIVKTEPISDKLICLVDAAANRKQSKAKRTPPSITNFEAVNVTSTTASLTWDPLLTNCPILEYKLQIQETVLRTNETSAFEVSFLVENNFYLLEDLIPSAKYSLNLTATTGGGTSDPASTEFQTLEGDYDAPVIDGLTASSPCSLVVVWECDEICSVGLNNFNIYWHQTGSSETLSVTEGYHTNFYEIQGLLSNTSYTVWVSSVKNDGEYNSPSSKASTYKGVVLKTRRQYRVTL
ncbi:hypothetical protein Avbf_05381 [Armadillidium vulgare]|nr:hypothetical protein Avbf_05381 [Armadillidium vulgare]